MGTTQERSPEERSESGTTATPNARPSPNSQAADLYQSASGESNAFIRSRQKANRIAPQTCQPWFHGGTKWKTQ